MTELVPIMYNIAIQVVRIVYPSCVDIGCFSHTLDIVGEKLKAPVLNMLSSLCCPFFHIALKLSFSGRNRWEITHNSNNQLGSHVVYNKILFWFAKRGVQPS